MEFNGCLGTNKGDGSGSTGNCSVGSDMGTTSGEGTIGRIMLEDDNGDEDDEADDIMLTG